MCFFLLFVLLCLQLKEDGASGLLGVHAVSLVVEELVTESGFVIILHRLRMGSTALVAEKVMRAAMKIHVLHFLANSQNIYSKLLYTDSLATSLETESHIVPVYICMYSFVCK